jgi:hypothetical protein
MGDPVASTTPRGLPAQGPRSAPGSVTTAWFCNGHGARRLMVHVPPVCGS